MQKTKTIGGTIQETRQFTEIVSAPNTTVNPLSLPKNEGLSQDCPFDIEEAHWNEWLASKIDTELITMNFLSLIKNEGYDYLLYSLHISRRNEGRLRDRDLKKYRHVEHGGWWCAGVDPLNDYKRMTWGCFKPNHPRQQLNDRNKFIKYEHPYKESTRALFLKMPFRLWQKVSDRYNILISEEDRSGDFWEWVLKYNVPVILCEGVKKAASLLSIGYAAIAIPGVNAGYRNPRDENGVKIGQPFLIPDLQHFATSDREFSICFDHDLKPETVKNVASAITQTSRLLSDRGCLVQIIRLPGPEKGVDDFLVAGGDFDELYLDALTIEQFIVSQYSQLTHPRGLTLNQRFLGELDIPDDAKLIGIKSGKGTGKTQSFIPIVKEALRNGQPTLLLTHRIQLGEALGEIVGVPFVSKIHDSETGAMLGYSICTDSLHPNSQARFNADAWKDSLVIIDEAEQVIWHTLTASTEIQKHRVEVIRQMAKLLHNVLTSKRGRVILSDADLSDLSLEFILGMASVSIEPWIVENTWKPETGCNIYHYDQTTPVAWQADLEQYIEGGGKPFIVTHCQKVKSKWGTINLEARLVKLFPHLRILRIDSHTVSDPTHPAFACIGNLNEILKDYDVVLTSPAIETGVSIDLRSHFTSVWGCFHGVSPDNSSRQALARVREGVDRHIWAASLGLGTIGNGGINFKSLLSSEYNHFKANLHMLQNAGMSIDFDDVQINRTALNVWAKMACRVNAGMLQYRSCVIAGLKAEGHQILAPGAFPTQPDLKQLMIEISENQRANYSLECDKIADADVSHLSPATFKKLSQQKSKTPDERRQEKKYGMQQVYGVDVTPEIIKLDDDGWYPQIRLHYFLTIGKSFLSERDQRAAGKSIHNGQLWMPDFNRSQLGASVASLEFLGIAALLDDKRQYRGNDEDLQQLSVLAHANRKGIKDILKTKISENDNPIVVLRRILKKIGYKLQLLGRDGTGERQRFYGIVPIGNRDEIFQAWLARDSSTSTNGN